MLVPCIYGDYLKTLENIDSNKIRALFYFTSGERLPKSIHYFKNIRTVNIHTVEVIEPDNCWLIRSSETSGYFSSHYRNEVEQFFQNYTNSIRNLNFDFEYLFFILKKYSEFC